MSNDDKTPATGNDLDQVRSQIRLHRQEAETEHEDLRRQTWMVLLGAVGIAQWILLALPWFTEAGDEVTDGQVSGWRLLLVGLQGVVDANGGGEVVLGVVVGIMPPAACLAAIVLIWSYVAWPTRRKANATQFVSIIAGLGFVGLYAVNWLSEDGPTFAATMFAAMTLWFLGAAIASKGYERG